MEFRKPRPDIPILPQSALYRTQPIKPFKAPKGRRGRKPKGQKLKPRTLSQFNKFHSEAARNKERDRAEQERIDKIKERDEARRERSERLQIEDRRYAAKVITDARDRAAERNFRAEQLRLLRQQAAAPPPALPPPPAINIAPPAVNIAPAAVEVRPVINLPAGGGAALPDPAAARDDARRFADLREELRRDIRSGFAQEAARLPQIADAAQARADAAIRQVEERSAAALEQRRREAAEAREERDRIAQERDEEGLAAAQAQRDLLLQAQQRQQELEAASEERIRAAQRQAQRQLEEAAGARGEAEQELTQQLSRAQTARNQAEARANENRIRAEELQRHNEALQGQRDQDPVDRAALRREVVDGVREEIEIDIGDRLEQQYRDLVLRQASEAQRNDPAFQARLEQEAFRVGDRLEIPFGGGEVSDEDRPFRINPFRPENEEFLRRALAESRVLQGGLSQLRREQGITEKVPMTQEQVDREIEAIRRIEREEQRRRLGRGGTNPPSVAGFERDFSSEEEEQQPQAEALRATQVSRRNITLDPPQIPELTESQVDRDFDEIEARRPVDFSLEFDEEAADRAAGILPRAGGSGGSERRETPREQADRQALERQSSQERVTQVLREPEPQPESLDSSLESLESEQDNWEIVTSNFKEGQGTSFHRGRKGRDSLRPDRTHFTFRDDEGFLGKSKTAQRFRGQDLVIMDVNPKNSNVLVRTKDSVGTSMRERSGVEGNIKFGLLNNLVELGSINLQEIDHNLQPVEEAAQPSVVGRAAGAVGGAAATVGGVVGNAALGAVRGAGQRAYEELPTAGQTGEALGRAAVAVGSGIAGAVRGAYQAATSPRDPQVGEQTGGGLLPVGLGRVEDTDEI